MKISVLGASGMVGRRVILEALNRRHEVTAVLRTPEKARELPCSVAVRVANIANSHDMARVSSGAEVVVNATRPPSGQEHEVVRNTQQLLHGMRNSAARLVVVGGAASLTVPESGGRLVLDDPNFLSPSYRHIGLASLQQYEICRKETDIDWTYLSPPADLLPGVRTGSYRTGRDELLLNSSGRSQISVEDLAVALLDEVEKPRHHRQRFTVAY